MPEFDTGNVVATEFGVCRQVDDDESYAMVPVDDSVKAALRAMLSATIQALVLPPNEDEISRYEPAEKYASTESLYLPLDSDLCAGPRLLFESVNIPIDANATAEPSTIEYYFACFRDNEDRTAVGVRRATQFKGVVGARGRLLRMIDDTMQLLEDTVFKLDMVFDYVITAERVYILHPSGFEYTSDIEDHILEHAVNNLTALAEKVNFINFAALDNFVRTHKRAARLLASLRTRADLADTSLERLKDECAHTGVVCVEAGGKIGPALGQEMNFLMVLDRRRYAISLIDDVDETYEAASRRLV